MAESVLTLEDERIGKAGELADFLRQNPRETRRDPEELAARFGVSPGLVSQLQASRAFSGREHGKHRITDFRKLVSNLMGLASRFANLILERAYVVQVVASLTLIASGFLAQSDLRSAAAVAYLSLNVVCMFFRPQYRYLVFGSVLAGISLAAEIIVRIKFHPSGQPPIETHGVGLAFLCVLAGIVATITYAFLMGMVMLVGGLFALSAARKREQAKTRQDLLTRMFQLQEKLASIPVKVHSAGSRFSGFVRKQLLLCSGLTVLFLTGAEAIGSAKYHIKIQNLHNGNVSYGLNGSIHVTGSNDAFRALPLSYISLSLGIQILGLAALVYFGIMYATSTKKLFTITFGMALGQALAYAIAYPLGGTRGVSPKLLAADLLGAIAFRIIVLSMARFAVLFNKTLAASRRDFEPDEAAILSELVEIRHRLSSNPVPVCVLVVDAAGSTRMKEGMDPLCVEYSFRSYQSWLAGIVAARGGKVDVMTGDGAICAFGTASAALDAAKDMQCGVASLNAERNRLPSPFRLRIALHSGAVVADLDKVQFTNVIDVAAHVEKHSPVGGMAITQPFVSQLAGLDGLEKCGNVDGVDVFVLPAEPATA